MFSSTKSQAGLTLIEMMIALLIGLIITAGVLTIFVSNIKSSTENTKMIRMNQQLRSTMNLMTDELRRAGYSSSQSELQNVGGALNYVGATQCLRYSYAEPDGSFKNHAFELANGVIYWRENAGKDCSEGGIQPLTDINIIEITKFDIGPSFMISTADNKIKIPRLKITLTGKTSLNPGEAQRSISTTVRVRNECVVVKDAVNGDINCD
jgi:prepilin-type N-terminal cleavage/methylation domain-containing protein